MSTGSPHFAVITAGNLSVSAVAGEAACTDGSAAGDTDGFPWGLAVHAFDGGLVLHQPVSGRLLGFNGVAAMVWKGLEGGRDAARIAGEVAGVWGISLERARRDIDEFIASLRASAETGRVADTGVPHLRPAPIFGPGDEVPDARLLFRLADRVVGVELPDPLLRAELESLLGHLLTRARTADAWLRVSRDPLRPRGWRLALPDGRTYGDLSDADVVQLTMHQLVETAIAGGERMAALHAAAVARNGSVLVLAGPGGAGKSTLAAGLARDGFDYLADDVTLVDTRGGVLPLPMPHCLKSGSWAPLGEVRPDIDARPVYRRCDRPVKYLSPPAKRGQGNDGRDGWPVKALVHIGYRAGARAVLRRIRPLESLQRLAAPDQSHGVVVAGERVADFLQWLESRPSFHLEYGDHVAAAARLLALSRLSNREHGEGAGD